MNARDALGLRALNYLRSTHLPTYVALRMMLESTARPLLPKVIQDAISQTTVRKRDRTLELRRFKSSSEGVVKYRKYFVPSPTGALADAYALNALHLAEVLPRRADVYSYRPPPSRGYGRNYEYFASGYAERNEAISAVLRMPNAVAIVLDITNFYPSVAGEVALTYLLDKCESASILTSRDTQIIEAAAVRAISPNGGLLVGMEMSHALASLYLERLDNELRLQFPGRYFRYVDDIVVVTHPARVRDSIDYIDAALDRCGLRRNPGKDAIAGAAEWDGFRFNRMAYGKSTFDSLSGLKFRLKLYLSRHPHALDGLRAGLGEHGIYLPLDQLLDGSRDADWRERVVSYLKRGWDVAFRYRWDTAPDVISAAVECRNVIIRSLDAILDCPVEGEAGGVARRWKIQRARYTINRALYFVGQDRFRAICEFVEDVPELAEVRAVCESLLGNFSLLSVTPGPAVAAATQLIALRGLPALRNASAFLDSENWHIAADLAAHLSIRGLHSEGFSVPSDWPEDGRGLVAFAANAPLGQREASPGYGAEVFALGCGFTQDDRIKIARTRYAASEAVVFDALSLDSAYAS